MINSFNRLLVLILFTSNSFKAPVCAQSANAMISAVYNRMAKTSAYRAEVLITTDLPMIKIDPVQATLIFNQKEQFKLISKGIAVLPRQGLNDLPFILRDTNSFASIIMGKEKINTVLTTVINVIPNSDTGTVVLAKLWVDPQQSIVYKSQVTTRENGTLIIEYFYNSKIALGLPDSIIFTVDVKKFKMPKGMTTDINRLKETEDNKLNASKPGKITMRISDYKF